MKRSRGPGIFPESLPVQLKEILTWVGVDARGNPHPFIDEDWSLQACQFVNGDPSRLEIIFTGILGGRLRLTVSAKKLGQGWFEAGEIWGDGDPALTPIAKQLSSLVQETVIPKQPDVSLDMDLLTMGRSKI
jgi:hypothetical protein